MNNSSRRWRPGSSTRPSWRAACAGQAGCADQSAACLRPLPVSTILAKQAGGAPNVDGYVLPASIVDSFGSGAFNRVPVVEGSNHDEWRLFVAQAEAASGTP